MTYTLTTGTALDRAVVFIIYIISHFRWGCQPVNGTKNLQKCGQFFHSWVLVSRSCFLRFLGPT